MAADEDEVSQKPSVPAWQLAKENSETTPAAKASSAQRAAFEQARSFLQDAEVRNTSRERKADFLKSKGFDSSVVEALLAEDAQRLQDGAGDSASRSKDAATDESASTKVNDHPGEAGDASEQAPQARGEAAPPIITYPEFLAQRRRPSPLITMDGLLTTVYAFSGLSALLYGTSHYVLAPMADSLTDARVSLHSTAAENLNRLIEKLEGTVSQVPASLVAAPAPVHKDDEDDDNDDDDNGESTELFQRDIGVQTSPPPSWPSSPARLPEQTGHLSTSREEQQEQAWRVAQLVADARAVNDGITAQSDEHTETAGVLGELAADLARLAYRRPTDVFSGFYGASSRSGGSEEPDDEIRRAKDNIRRLKGVLLSTRMFPGTVR